MGILDRTTRRTRIPNITLLVLILACVLPFASSHDLESSNAVIKSALFGRLAQSGRILIDHEIPPSINKIVVVERQVENNDDASTSTTLTASKTISTREPTAKASPAISTASVYSVSSASSSPSSTSSTNDQPTALPRPFDTSLGNNFTDTSCPQFFNGFLNNATFQSCLPVSLLLQNSRAFFQACRSKSLLKNTLDNSCKASLAICSPLMSGLADDLISLSNCGADYNKQNPIVMQAYAGLIAYEPLYNATCLQNTASGDYCFSEAVVNTTNPSDMYPYYTAIGMPLPSSAQPTCNKCLQKTMAIFADYAQMREQPLSRTYLGCASQVDGACGASFADTQVHVGVQTSKNFASAAKAPSFTIGVVAVMLVWQLLF